MKIQADTRAELNEAIEAHEAQGWTLIDWRRWDDGSYTATFAMLKNEPEQRAGDWITTYTGKKFYPLDPRAEDICIEDIAHSLSLQCRFNGHTRRFYSVAEHCWHLSHIVSPENALAALLHDASETYFCDIPRPLKPMIPQYGEIESNVMRAVADKFGLPRELPDEVKIADHRILADEARRLLFDWSWAEKIEPLHISLSCWSWEDAEVMFLERFNELTRK